MPDQTAYPRPRVLVLGTGGTIAGSSAATAAQAYQAGVVDVGDLLRAVPGVDDIARLVYEQAMQVDSCDLDLPRQLDIVQAVQRAVDRDDVDGVVVTHGTDTMEETTYLAHLLVTTDKPVVFVGAMRPADAVSADGPGNLRTALVVATSMGAGELGALLVQGEEVHGAREVRKHHASRVQAFASAHGPLGEVVDGRLEVRARPTRRFGATSEIDLETVARLREGAGLPQVETVVGRAGLPESLLEGVARSGATGIVHVGHGAGNIPTDVRPRLAALAADGVVVVRATRVAEGIVARNGAVPDDDLGFVAGDDLGPAKARLLLTLALTRTRDTAEIQAIFDTH